VDSEDLRRQHAALRARSTELVQALRGLDEADLLSPSLLPDWSRLTIACHLRYGAEALRRMTDGANVGQPVAYYPEGRAVMRPGTLTPRHGEGPLDVVSSLARQCDQLDETWSILDRSSWHRRIEEPVDNRDLGPLLLSDLLLLRLTELEVHGSDLGLEMEAWSEVFIRAALPARLDRLNTRRTNHREVDASLSGTWLLVATDGPSHLIEVDGTRVVSRPADRASPATAVIEASSRDLLALLLGRPFLEAPRVTGDAAFGEAFTAAFPGP
jgi:uncharacterized protein (TIGR03083 family)